ncbi:ABC transporter substrate-binding protein [Herpetosiphon gulosus]|uniref:Riboflavin-binding protein RibY n=1 Tax=Herpetosiphon gulosus TaxID=1973496 RepID=A0ABP9X4C6_9CHLR
MRYRRVLAVVGLLFLAACGGQTATPTAVSGNDQAKPLTKVTIAMPYVPNIQFAPFYLAKTQGYYEAEGLDVTFDYQYETDSVQRVANGSVQFGMAGGDSVLLARAQGLPIMTVVTISQRSPIVFYSKAELNIKTPADLKGKSVGIPGRFGASYIGLLALMYSNSLQESDLNIQEIGFAQVQALSEDKVQVASGYGNNEPIQLAEAGVKLNIIRVSDSFALTSDGLIVSENLIKEQPTVVMSFVKATLKGMSETIADPTQAFNSSLREIPELQAADDSTKALQQKVLAKTIGYWQSDLTAKYGLGFTDQATWQATHDFLRQQNILKQDVAVGESFVNGFIATP